MVKYVGEYVGNMLVNMLYPLVNEEFANWKITIFKNGKSTN
jgi:hypothetical protein